MTVRIADTMQIVGIRTLSEALISGDDEYAVMIFLGSLSPRISSASSSGFFLPQ